MILLVSHISTCCCGSLWVVISSSLPQNYVHYAIALVLNKAIAGNCIWRLLFNHLHPDARNQATYPGSTRDGALVGWRAGDWEGLLDPDMNLKFSEFQPSSSRDKESGGQRRAAGDIAQALALVRRAVRRSSVACLSCPFGWSALCRAERSSQPTSCSSRRRPPSANLLTLICKPAGDRVQKVFLAPLQNSAHAHVDLQACCWQTCARGFLCTARLCTCSRQWRLAYATTHARHRMQAEAGGSRRHGHPGRQHGRHHHPGRQTVRLTVLVGCAALTASSALHQLVLFCSACCTTIGMLTHSIDHLAQIRCPTRRQFLCGA